MREWLIKSNIYIVSREIYIRVGSECLRKIMTLTFNLGTEVRGDKLAEIVQASMREIDDWQFETKKGAGIVEVYAQISGADPGEIFFSGFPYSGTISFVSINCSRKNNGIVAYCLRKRGDRQYSRLCFPLIMSVLNPVFLGLVMEEYEDIVNEEFVSEGSIFTLIYPEKGYSQLEFHANAAFDFKSPQNSGAVQQIESPQFREIQPTYDRLIEGIIGRLPQQSAYRTKALVL